MNLFGRLFEARADHLDFSLSGGEDLPARPRAAPKKRRAAAIGRIKMIERVFTIEA